MSNRRKRSPEEQARREKIRELLQSSGVSSMEDIQNLFKETIAEFMENGLDAELDTELGYSRYDYKNKDTDNSRNGHSSKTLRTSFGDVEVSVPRDRKGEFDPQILKKNQTSISQDVEEKILSMYAKGMTTSDIEAHIRDIYGIEVSDTTVSRVTDKILPIAKEWQQRPLEAIYAVVFLDAIHYHVRSEGQIINSFLGFNQLSLDGYVGFGVFAVEIFQIPRIVIGVTVDDRRGVCIVRGECHRFVAVRQVQLDDLRVFIFFVCKCNQIRRSQPPDIVIDIYCFYFHIYLPKILRKEVWGETVSKVKTKSEKYGIIMMQ